MLGRFFKKKCFLTWELGSTVKQKKLTILGMPLITSIMYLYIELHVRFVMYFVFANPATLSTDYCFVHLAEDLKMIEIIMAIRD